jgi:hypothetical protein
MAHQKSKDEKNGNGFWFGMMMGSVVGTAGLYLFGTANGRDKLREVLQAFDELNTDVVEDLKHAVHTKDDHAARKVVTDIHTVLDKIESSIPSKKDIQKYFVKDGKVLK